MTLVSQQCITGIIKNNQAGNEGQNIYPVNRKIAYEPKITDISKCEIEGVKTSYYNGKKIELDISIMNENDKLIKDTDYKVTYKNNVNPGEATIQINGIGIYKGSINKKFKIIKNASVNTNEQYYIVSALRNSRVIDIKEGSIQTGNNMLIKTINCTKSQKFKFTKNNDGSYYIQNPEITNSAKEKWFVGKNSDETLSFYTSDGKVLEATGEKNNSKIQINDENKNTSQKFKIRNSKELSAVNIDTNKYYYIVSSINNKKAIDVYGAGTANFTNVNIYDLNKTKAQIFRFQKNADGSYIIINKGSNKALDIYGNKTKNMTNIDIYTINHTTAQDWNIIKNSDGTITFLGVESGKALDLYAANVKNFTNIHIWDWNQTNAQKWKLMQ